MFAALLLFASQEKECIFASRFLSLMFLFIRLFVLMHVYGGGGTCRWPDVAHSIFFVTFTFGGICVNVNLEYLFLLPTSYAVSRANIIFHLQVDMSEQRMI